jgi:uncharacterized iron-regulated membrane protein
MSLKRWLYLLHRWLGIALCLVMALWFLSGMVMLYVGYPKLTAEEQAAGLPPLALEQCCVPLAEAVAAAGGPQAAPAPWRLSSVAGEPRYLFGDGRRAALAVDARSGQRIRAVSEAQALAAASHFAGGAAAEYQGLVQEDAWTHSRALDAHRPLHRVAVADEARRWLYVSSVTGEVVRDATLTERRWGWLGAWLHWLYIFRGGALDAAWAQIVIWLSVAGGVLALSGLVVGLWRWRFSGHYKSGSRSPYRESWMRWHHLLGLVGGSLALTWVLSGLFSMNPWKVFEAPGPAPDRRAYAGGALQAQAGPEVGPVLAALAARGEAAPRWLEWRRVDGQQFLLAQSPTGGRALAADGTTRPPWSEAALAQAAQRLLPEVPLASREWLHKYDRYYYGREAHTMTGQRERPLPVLRLRFDDAQAHWVTLDPATGAILQLSNRHQRVERWLFAFLHSFDLPILLAARPAWDAWMLGFSATGLALCLSGVVLGWRRLRGPRRPAGRAQPGRHL